MNHGPVYLDYSASTPVDERVLEAMRPYFAEQFGNPSSVHRFGQAAEKALEKARRTVAEILNASPHEIIFTGGGSEADNLAIRGVAFAARAERGANHLLTTPVEHPAVLETFKQLAGFFGFELALLPVDEYGRVEPGEVEKAVRADTALVSVVYASNEVGTIQPIAEIGEMLRRRGIPFHTDAVQAAGHLKVNVRELNLDLMSLGAHKFYGPKGVGVLYARDGLPILPMQTGGSHERNLRAGTSNIPYIVGLAEALRITAEKREEQAGQFRALRDRIVAGVMAWIQDARLTGHPTERLPNHASFVFRGLDGNELLMHLDLEGFACSSGSACKTGDPKPSGVLLAMGIDPDWALGSLRVTVGRPTTGEDVERFLEVLPGVVERMRAAEGNAR